MPKSFVSESIQPLEGFDPAGMIRGEPGMPVKFRWRKREFAVAEVLEAWKEHGDCKHGSGERYLRKHGYRIRMDDGAVWRIYFQRSFGKAHKTTRWWLHSVEEMAEAHYVISAAE